MNKKQTKEFKRYLFANQGKVILKYRENGETNYLYVNSFDGKNIQGVIIDKKNRNQLSIDNLLEKDKLKFSEFKEPEELSKKNG